MSFPLTPGLAELSVAVYKVEAEIEVVYLLKLISESVSHLISNAGCWTKLKFKFNNQYFIRSSGLICALRGDDEAVCWVSVGQQKDGKTDLKK